MMDLLSMSVLLVLSSLVQQTDGGMDAAYRIGTGTEPAKFSFEVNADAYAPEVQIIKIGIAGFSLLLLGLSITAYRKTGIKSALYAALAFGLFAAQLLFDYLEDAVFGFEQPFNDVIFYTMTLAILVLFFLAVTRRQRR